MRIACDLFQRLEIVRQHRLLVPDEVEVLEQRRLALVAEHVEPLVDVDHQPHARAESAAHGFDACAVCFRIRVVDLHLVVPAAVAGVLLRFADQVVRTLYFAQPPLP